MRYLVVLVAALGVAGCAGQGNVPREGKATDREAVVNAVEQEAGRSEEAGQPTTTPAPNKNRMKTFTETFYESLDAADCLEDFDTLEKAVLYDHQLRGELKQKRREWYCSVHPELPAFTAECIRSNRFCVGMNQEQVHASIGRPADVNRTVTAYAVHEQWIYERAEGRCYLYFDDGVMTSWQD